MNLLFVRASFSFFKLGTKLWCLLLIDAMVLYNMKLYCHPDCNTLLPLLFSFTSSGRRSCFDYWFLRSSASRYWPLAGPHPQFMGQKRRREAGSTLGRGLDCRRSRFRAPTGMDMYLLARSEACARANLSHSFECIFIEDFLVSLFIIRLPWSLVMASVDAATHNTSGGVWDRLFHRDGGGVRVQALLRSSPVRRPEPGSGPMAVRPGGRLSHRRLRLV